MNRRRSARVARDRVATASFWKTQHGFPLPRKKKFMSTRFAPVETSLKSVLVASDFTLSVKNRLDEVKFRCFPVKRTLRRQECSPRRSGGERTVYLSCSTKRFPPSCCFASRRQRSNETDAGRPVQRKLLAAGPANHTGGSRNRHGGDWLPGRPQGEGFRNPESGFCDRCGDVLRV